MISARHTSQSRGELWEIIELHLCARFLAFELMYFLQKAKFNALCPLSTDSTPDTTKNRTSSTWSLYLVVSTTSPLGFSLCLEKEINAVLVFSGAVGIHVWGCCRPLLTCHLLLHHYPAEIAPEHLLFQQFQNCASSFTLLDSNENTKRGNSFSLSSYSGPESSTSSRLWTSFDLQNFA